MKQVSLGGLDVSWLGLGAMGMSAFAENANRGDHALLLSPWRTSTPPCCCARACLDPADASLPGCPPDGRHRSAAVRRRIPASHENSPVPELRRPAPAFSPA